MSERLQKNINDYIKEAMDFSRRSSNVRHTSSTINTELQDNVLADNYEDFLRTHTSVGSLRVQASSAQGIFPIENATVAVSLNLGDGEKTLFNTATDESGIAENITLPTLPSSLSKKEVTADNSGTQYKVSVFHPAFKERIIDTVTIFENIETILPISLMPTVIKEGEPNG